MAAGADEMTGSDTSWCGGASAEGIAEPLPLPRPLPPLLPLPFPLLLLLLDPSAVAIIDAHQIVTVAIVADADLTAIVSIAADVYPTTAVAARASIAPLIALGAGAGAGTSQFLKLKILIKYINNETLIKKIHAIPNSGASATLTATCVDSPTSGVDGKFGQCLLLCPYSLHFLHIIDVFVLLNLV